MLRVLELVIETGPVHFKNAIRTMRASGVCPIAQKGREALD